MKRTRLVRAALPAAIALLAACQSDSPESNPKGIATSAEEYRSPEDVRFLSDAEGNVPGRLPVAVLEDMRQQLLAQGKAALLEDLEARYDFTTGEVKDPRAAERAERFLKSRLAAKPAGTPEAREPEAADRRALDPEELPAAIKITDDMIEGLRKAAAEGGAE